MEKSRLKNFRSVTTSVTVSEVHSDVRMYTEQMQMYCVTTLPKVYIQSLGMTRLVPNRYKGSERDVKYEYVYLRYVFQ
jgi:hypothetical protein